VPTHARLRNKLAEAAREHDGVITAPALRAIVQAQRSGALETLRWFAPERRALLECLKSFEVAPGALRIALGVLAEPVPVTDLSLRSALARLAVGTGISLDDFERLMAQRTKPGTRSGVVLGEAEKNAILEAVWMGNFESSEGVDRAMAVATQTGYRRHDEEVDSGKRRPVPQERLPQTQQVKLRHESAGQEHLGRTAK
jgi:hypothetical protein